MEKAPCAVPVRPAVEFVCALMEPEGCARRGGPVACVQEQPVVLERMAARASGKPT